eukprot:7847434-Lingulodinium_polyedra.AAC.1
MACHRTAPPNPSKSCTAAWRVRRTGPHASSPTPSRPSRASEGPRDAPPPPRGRLRPPPP